MTGHRWNIGPLSTRRRIAAAIAVVGVVIVAGRLGSAWPRDVEVAYEVAPTVDELDADYLRSGSAVASVRFNRSAQKPGPFRHIVRLQPGEYRIQITLHGHDGSAEERFRTLSVPTSGLTRFDLRRARAASP